MIEFLSKAKEQAILYWMVVLYFIFFTISSLTSAWLLATAGANWHELDIDSKVRIVVGCTGVFSTTMLAFLNKSISRAQSGKPLIGPEEDDKTNEKTNP